MGLVIVGLNKVWFDEEKKKIRNWFVSSILTAGQFSNGDISFVNRWIGLKFLLEVLYMTRKSSTGGIFDLISQ
jgi:hypothetical protein